MTEENLSPPPSANSRKSSQIYKFFSTSSSRNSAPYVFYDQVNAKPQWDYSYRSREIYIKMAQTLVAVACTGLYSKGLHAVKNSITTMIFPNVVFSTFIIITSVILLSYALGHIMPEVLIRIFNTLGTILYFVSSVITGQYWYVQGRHEEDVKSLYINMLLAETILSFVNTILYGLDVYFSVKNTLKSLELHPEEMENDRRKSVRKMSNT